MRSGQAQLPEITFCMGSRSVAGLWRVRAGMDLAGESAIAGVGMAASSASAAPGAFTAPSLISATCMPQWPYGSRNFSACTQTIGQRGFGR